MSIGAVALPGTGSSGGTSVVGATAVGDVDTVVGDAVLRALAARIAARRSIGVRGGPGAVDCSIFSVFILGVDSGGGIGGREAV
jgi:hypothetical protein